MFIAACMFFLSFPLFVASSSALWHLLSPSAQPVYVCFTLCFIHLFLASSLPDLPTANYSVVSSVVAKETIWLLVAVDRRSTKCMSGDPLGRFFYYLSNTAPLLCRHSFAAGCLLACLLSKRPTDDRTREFARLIFDALYLSLSNILSIA